LRTSGGEDRQVNGSALARLLRWSWRDLRSRWLQVLAIALIIGLGCGLYAGLGSTATWRRLSNDASYEQLRFHHLRIEVADATFAREGELAAATGRIGHPEWIAAVNERLIVPTQFDVPTPPDRTGEEGEVLLPGQLTGMAPDATVDLLWPRAGRALQPADSGRDVMVFERNVAATHGLAVTGTAALAGGHRLDWVGHALHPEWFVVTDPQGGFLSGASYGVGFTSLATAQRLAGRPGLVNDAVIRLAPGADVASAAAEIEAALAGIDPPVAATVTTREDVVSYHVLYQDIEGDQQVWNALSAIVLAGAAFAASNLVSRMIEAQRREVGIGLALGAPLALLAVRPLLVGVQIGLAGVALGVASGWLINRGFRSVLDTALPLPTWLTPFQFGPFFTAAGLGLGVALLATLLPVWRAVRMTPLDALQRVRPTSGRTLFAPRSRRRVARGRALAVLPFRDLLRAPRRTVLTALGIGASISVLVSVLGMMDSFFGVIDQSAAEMGGSERSVTVELIAPLPASSPAVDRLGRAGGVAAANSSLALPGKVGSAGREPFDALIEAGGILPTISRGRPPGPGEVALAAKAMVDLNVDLGDTVTVRHSRIGAGGAAEMVTSSYRVSGVHRNPLRSLVYADAEAGAAFGLDGFVNQVRLEPAPGVSSADLQRLAFSQPDVRAARSLGVAMQQLRDGIDQYLNLLRVVEAIPLGLALLVGFNSSLIGAEEHRRDHATMFAFGITPARVVGLLMVEALALALVGTAAGLLGGWAVTRWIIETILPETLPELGMRATLRTSSLLGAAVLGVVAVALGRLLVTRRLRRLDVPSTLRVVE
jgi:putative ABC transport system permease protein